VPIKITAVAAATTTLT